MKYEAELLAAPLVLSCRTMPETKSLLEYAVRTLGRPELAARLKVSESTLDAWLSQGADMTNSKALALADLIYELSKAQK